MPTASTWPWPDRTAELWVCPIYSDIIYAYPEIRILAHEPSLAERGLMSAGLVERVELMDEEKFFEEMLESDGIILL